MKRPGNIILLLILLMTSPAIQAKSTDAKQPLHIEADSVEIREKEGISIYRGHVVISRGSTLIKGQMIKVTQKNDTLEEIYVKGNPATFSQLNDENQPVSAQSREMEYQARKGILTLKKNAVLEQVQNRFTSDHIIYNTEKDIVQAGAESQNNNDEKTPRIMITIHPENNNKDTTTP